MRVKDAVGKYGEQVAVDHLQALGYVVLDRNWRCREGELDIVARDEDVLAFVEVKTRSSLAFGGPLDAVGAAKMARIRTLGLRWIAAARDRDPGAWWRAVRFDVVAVLRSRTGPPQIDLVRGAF